MNYTAIWSSKAQKKLSHLPLDLQEKILRKMKAIEEDPFHYLEHFEGNNYYKLRFGEYRALLNIDFEEKRLFVEIFDHRKRVYKR